MIAGLAVFGGSYVFSALVGGSLESGSATQPGQTCLNCDKGHLLYIPIVGPWLLMPHADAGAGQAVAAALGVAQAVGVLLSVIGIVQFVGSAPDETASNASHFAFGAVPLPGGAYADLRLRM